MAPETVYTIQTVANPVWADAGHTVIYCLATFEEIGGPYPYHVTEADSAQHGRVLWAQLITGKYGTVGAYVAPTLSPAEQFAALIAGGIAITSTGTPAVNGIYSCDEAQQAVITRLQAYISKSNTFPGGLSAVQLRLVGGTYIAVPSVALFQAVGTAIGDFVADADEAELAAAAGGAFVAPSNAKTIP